MVRTNQGGSILGFLIIGSVLALLLVGGAYFVRHNVASDNQDTDIAVQQDENEESDQSAQDQPDDSEAEQPSEDEGVEQPPQNEAEDQPYERDDAPANPLPSTGNQNDGDTPGTLPQTGIGNSLVGAMMLGGLAALLVLYRRSRALDTSL